MFKLGNLTLSLLNLWRRNHCVCVYVCRFIDNISSNYVNCNFALGSVPAQIMAFNVKNAKIAIEFWSKRSKLKIRRIFSFFSKTRHFTNHQAQFLCTCTHTNTTAKYTIVRFRFMAWRLSRLDKVIAEYPQARCVYSQCDNTYVCIASRMKLSMSIIEIQFLLRW